MTSLPTAADLRVCSLGAPRFDSPLAEYVRERQTNEHYVDEDDRVIFLDTLSQLQKANADGLELPSFEPAGPRRRLFFPTGETTVGVVTCGGLCPGLNDVLRGLVMELSKHYGVRDILGFAHGFAGLVPGAPEPVALSPAVVHDINSQGGTVLGTSRGAQDPAVMVDTLVRRGIDLLFVIGGDGTMHGAAGIAAELRRRDLPIGVVGIPKTIDNDIPYIEQSFGFVTAFGAAAKAIHTAMIEARAAVGGVGLVKLMGRHSGFIACYAALANHEADFVLIPEVPFALEGENGFLASLHRRVLERGHAVVVVAEGAGQDVLADTCLTDASGNAQLADIGAHLKESIAKHFADQGTELTCKYIDPGYMIRSVPADPHDAVYCLRLAQTAAHAGMAGRTDMVVGRRHNRFVHVPISVVISERNLVAPDGDLWLSVLESTTQPIMMR